MNRDNAVWIVIAIALGLVWLFFYASAHDDCEKRGGVLVRGPFNDVPVCVKAAP